MYNSKITGEVTLYGPYPDGCAPKGVWQRIRHVGAWERRHDTGRWRYEENTMSGRRRAIPVLLGPHQPVAAHWLEGGNWDRPRPAPPPPLRPAKGPNARRQEP